MPRPGRTFLALDVNYFDDPVVFELSDMVQLLDVRGMAYLKRLQVDGGLTRRQLRRLAPESAPEIGASADGLIDELIESGLWIDTGAEIVRRRWLDWNVSAENIEKMSRGGKRGNHTKWHVVRENPDPDCEFCIAEGLVSPPDIAPDSPGDRGGESPGDRGGESQDKTTQTNTYLSQGKGTYLATVSSSNNFTRADVDQLAERASTIEEARAELEARGMEERDIAFALSLMPGLRSEAVAP
jgi:hypothetical protein